MKCNHCAKASGSHWDGCWRDRGHHACAVARCEELEAECSYDQRNAAMSQEESVALLVRLSSMADLLRRVLAFCAEHGIGGEVFEEIEKEIEK